ncbi:MAG: MqnA/MqnD/SBP family protein, partial [Ignavibacteria bacterium]|nr:MqnA/MqnD/SBP family protein [Ignavibacteria bacterium]
KNTQALALIPSLELIKHKDLLVSNKLGISFDGMLSNAYYYFSEGERAIKKILVRGDVSVNEIILAKILFEERYSSNVELVLDTTDKMDHGKDYIVSGDYNYTSEKYERAISLADEVSEMLDFPYVNFILVSKDRESLTNFEKQIDSMDEIIEEKLAESLGKLDVPQGSKDFIKENFSSVYYDLTENEKDGLTELIKLVYYRGIIEDMFDIKFV